MTDPQLEALAADARRVLGSGGAQPHPAIVQPRFELFSAPNSICSQKVRVVLAHHELPYVSNSINLFRGESYLPEYVRLRIRGCDSLGPNLANRHNGSSSAAAGCDPAVVPTLIDWEAEEVIVDSKRICIYLDDLVPNERTLRPADLVVQVDGQLDIVDHMPNYQMLMNRNAAGESETMNDVGNKFSSRKIAWCDEYLTQFRGDPVLERAYLAKRAKEVTAVEGLFSADSIADAYDRVERSLDELEGRLARRKGIWIFGEHITMADLFWGIELLRIENLDRDRFFRGRYPEIERFLAYARALPSIRAGVIDWPGAMF